MLGPLPSGPSISSRRELPPHKRKLVNLVPDGQRASVCGAVGEGTVTVVA